MKNRLIISSTVAIVFGSFVFAQPASATTINVALGEMNFGATTGTIQPADIGKDAGLGFSHRYNDVFEGVDAVATVLAVENIDGDDDETNGADGLMDEFDEADDESGRAIDLSLDVFGESGGEGVPAASSVGKVTFRLDFVEADSNKAVTLQNIAMRVVDIDNNQFAQFAGITAYELSSNPATVLTATGQGGAYEFSEPVGETSSTDDEENWVAVEYAEASTITITLGGRLAGGASFGLTFADTEWSEAPTRTTPELTPYTLSYDANEASEGSVPQMQSSTTLSTVVTLAAPQGDLVKTNCAFEGWNTKTDGSGSTFLDSEPITLTANTTLYAQWNCEAPEETTGGEELADTGEELDYMAMAALFAIVTGLVLFALGRRKRA
ncbi:MAG: InlB B-repeat-containing protein [Rhodoluna sp.]